LSFGTCISSLLNVCLILSGQEETNPGSLCKHKNKYYEVDE